MISVIELDYRYRRRMPLVITGVTENFARGAVNAITGPSGSGKSTLLYLLALMLRPESGEILWNGRPVQGQTDGQRAALRATKAGFVFQDALLDPSRSVLDNVLEQSLFARMERRTAENRAKKLLEEFGVEHRADHRPGEISGGQAQRVALCRALLTDSKVIFADEPTGNLDDASAEVVWRALRAKADQGATVIVATHDIAWAGTADHRVELK